MSKKSIQSIQRIDLFFIIVTSILISSFVDGPVKAKGQVLPLNQKIETSVSINLPTGVPPISEEERIVMTPQPVSTKNEESEDEESVRPTGKFDYVLKIPEIDVEAPVLGLGLTPGGLMAVPDNYTEVGWYSLGAAPGEAGNAVLGAHVDNGAAIDGVFKNLKKLGQGDDVYLFDKNGQKLHFSVTKRDIYDYRMQDTSEVFGKTGKRQLKIITCYGNFLPSENTYDERLVITAELLES